MADWYCSSVAYAAVTQWSAGAVVTTGMLRRQLATPSIGNERVFLCTTGGTTGGTEPTWNVSKGSTTSDNGVVWTEVTGNSSHQHDNGVTTTWTAPFAIFGAMLLWMANGDRGFVSSDHSESSNISVAITPQAVSQYLSVNRTSGNIPPLPADLTPGASVAAIGSNHSFTIHSGGYWYGITLQMGTGTDSNISMIVGSDANSAGVYDTCTFRIGTNQSSVAFVLLATNSKGLFYNCTTDSGNGSIAMAIANAKAVFYNHSFTGTVPTGALFRVQGGEIEVHNSDFSALNSTYHIFPLDANGAECRARLVNCKLSSTINITSMGGSVDDCWSIDVVNCDSGAVNYDNRWYRRGGVITTETTITLVGGATDGTTHFSHKAVSFSTTTAISPLEFPTYSVWNNVVGVAKTATFEIQSNATLTNDDLWIEIEHLDSSGSPIGTLTTSRKATWLDTATNIPTSTATWASSVVSPVYQKVALTFTPQMVGLVRATVKLAKASQTVYVNPQFKLA